LAALIIKEFFRRSEDLTMSIPYILPLLVERLNAENIEGYDHLPDKMKPMPSQRALEMIDPLEKSETVRIQLATLVTMMCK
jgi:hypothetical protein